MTVLVERRSSAHQYHAGTVLVATPLDLIVALERGDRSTIVVGSLIWNLEIARFIGEV